MHLKYASVAVFIPIKCSVDCGAKSSQSVNVDLKVKCFREQLFVPHLHQFLFLFSEPHCWWSVD